MYRLYIIIRGEPERAPNTRVTHGEFAVPMYVCMYIVSVCMYVAIRRPRVYHACANVTVKIVTMLMHVHVSTSTVAVSAEYQMTRRCCVVGVKSTK